MHVFFLSKTGIQAQPNIDAPLRLAVEELPTDKFVKNRLLIVISTMPAACMIVYILHTLKLMIS